MAKAEGATPVKQSGVPRALFERYRFIVDFWPIITTGLVMSGAIGMHLYLKLLDVPADSVITIDEYVVHSVYGMLYLVFFVFLVTTLIVCSVMFGHQILTTFFPASARAVERVVDRNLDYLPSVLAIVVLIALTQVYIWQGPVEPKPVIALIVVPVTLLGLLTFVYLLGREFQRGFAVFVLVTTLLVAPAIGVYLGLSHERTGMLVAWPDGKRICPASASILWRGDKTLVLRCQGQLVVVDHPDNIVIRADPV
jgi:hypothetical protein